MVTTLEPEVLVSVDPVTPVTPVTPVNPVDPVAHPDGPQPGRSMEWRYSMPFAGVRVYSFRPEPPARKVPAPVQEVFPKPLKVELIDERVIVL